jgi:hypothetical protein
MKDRQEPHTAQLNSAFFKQLIKKISPALAELGKYSLVAAMRAVQKTAGIDKGDFIEYILSETLILTV